MKRRSLVFPLLLVGGGLILLGIAGMVVLSQLDRAPDRPSVVPVAVDFAAPALALADLEGQPVTLDNLYRQVFLINNWATWCPPCKAEMPTLQEYYDAHRDKGFTIVAIEAGGSPAEVRDFAQQYHLTFPVWVDEKALAVDAFKNWDLPSSYVMDRTGRVRLAWVGEISREMLEQYVTPLIEEASP